MYFRYPHYFWERKLITADDIIIRVAISSARDTRRAHNWSRNVNDDLLGTRTRSDNARPTSLSAASVKYRDKKIGIADWRERVLYLLINTQRRRTTFSMPRYLVI